MSEQIAQRADNRVKRNTAEPKNQAAKIQGNVEAAVQVGNAILFLKSRFEIQIRKYLIRRKNPAFMYLIELRNDSRCRIRGRKSEI